MGSVDIMNAKEWTAVAREEINDLRERIRATPLTAQPWPHLYVEEFFRPQTYASMVALFPRREQFHPQSKLDPKRYYGKQEKRLEIRFPHMLDRLTEEERAFWEPLSEELCGPEFASMLIERFADVVRERFGEAGLQPAFARERLAGAFMLNRHEPEYSLGPHTDIAEKVATCLLYMPEREGLDALGTTLYVAKDPRFASDGMSHHDPAGFEAVATVPFRPNSGLMFFRTPTSFHGVEALAAEDLNGSARAGFQMNFYERQAIPESPFEVSIVR